MLTEKHSKVLLATDEMAGLGQRMAERLAKRDETFGFSTIETTRFANGEVNVRLSETVRRREVYLLTSLQLPDPNSAFMRLLIANDAIARASAESIALVLPFMSYTRQDRKAKSREPISARLMADLIQVNPSVKRVLTFDLHSDQEQGFYSIPLDNLLAAFVHAPYFRQLFQGDFSNVVVVSPDFGGAVRARRFAELLGVPVNIIDKRRLKPNEAEVVNFVGGDITGKDICLFDDMCDTGGSTVAAAAEVRKRGARSVTAVVTHLIFSEKDGIEAEERFQEAGIKVVATESIPRSEEYLEAQRDWLTVLPLDEFLAEAVFQASKVGGSVSSLFGR